MTHLIKLNKVFPETSFQWWVRGEEVGVGIEKGERDWECGEWRGGVG